MYIYTLYIGHYFIHCKYIQSYITNLQYKSFVNRVKKSHFSYFTLWLCKTHIIVLQGWCHGVPLLDFFFIIPQDKDKS